MAWIDRIGGCFGSEDKMFALHGSDRTRAQGVLSEALTSNVGFAEYKKEIESWLKSQGCNEDHIARQMKRVSDLSSYFQYD